MNSMKLWVEKLSQGNVCRGNGEARAMINFERSLYCWDFWGDNQLKCNEDYGICD